MPEAAAWLAAGALPRVLTQSILGMLLVLAAVVAVAWRFPGGTTGVLGALCIVALVHVLRMSSSSSAMAPPPLLACMDFSARAVLAAAVAIGAAGALQRWPGAEFTILGAAAAVHVVGMVAAAAASSASQVDGAGGCNTSIASSSSGSESDLITSAAAAAAAGGEEQSNGDADAVHLVPVQVSVRTLPEVAPRRAPFAGTLEEHMVQIYAPPNKATAVWNAPTYGPALGVGTRAFLGSFKSDVSDISQKMSDASGVYV